jgi:hypothetical protein
MLRVHDALPRHLALPPGVTRAGGLLVIAPVRAPALGALIDLFARQYRDELDGDAWPSWAVAGYAREKSHGRPERWKEPGELASDGTGDCEDHVIYELVRLWARGDDARAHVINTRPGKFHALVRGPGGIVDPSRAARDARRGLFHYRKGATA